MMKINRITRYIIFKNFNFSHSFSNAERHIIISSYHSYSFHSRGRENKTLFTTDSILRNFRVSPLFPLINGSGRRILFTRIPFALTRWSARRCGTKARARKSRSFTIPRWHFSFIKRRNFNPSPLPPRSLNFPLMKFLSLPRNRRRPSL